MNRNAHLWLGLYLLSLVFSGVLSMPNSNRQCRNGVEDCYDDDLLCFDAFCVFDSPDMDMNKRHCEYVPIDCSDEDPCTINEQCNPEDGMCVADPNPDPSCHPDPMVPPCYECCQSNPYVYDEQIVLANRGDGTLTSLFTDTELVKDTHFPVNGGAEPIYMDVVDGRILLVGDRANNVVRYLDARTYEQYASVSICHGANHLFANEVEDQVWVACDVDQGFSVLSVSSATSIDHLVPIPADLMANFTSHDVTVGQGFAVAALSSTTGANDGWLVRYSTSTLTETARLQINGHGNVYHNGVPGSPVYVADEGGIILIVDSTTLAVLDQLMIPGPHDLTENNGILYVTDFSSEDGLGALYAFDVSANTLLPLAGSPYNSFFRNPHNLVTNQERTKLFIAHTRDSRVSVCDLNSSNGIIQQPCREVIVSGGFYDTQPSQAPNEVPYSDDFAILGFAAPMGIVRNTPLCECDTACWDDNTCTIDACHYVFPHTNHTMMSEMCYNYQIPGCSEDPYDVFCPTHQVNLTVVDRSIFELTPYYDGSLLEFCHTSTYQSNSSAMVLGFDEYQSCALNLRGTCDNRPTIHDSIPSYCAYDATFNATSPCLDNTHAVRAVDIPGIVNQLNFANTVVHVPTVLYDALHGTAHIQGELHDLSGDLVLHLDIVLSGASTAPQYPYKPMPLACYLDNDPADWIYFPHSNGRIYAKPGTPYEGLYIEITGTDTFTQLGFGASGRSVNKGLYGAYTWSVVHQPLNSQLAVSTTPLGPVHLWLDLDMNCFTPLDYCTLFQEPQAPPANNWTVTLNPSTSALQYCRNFTLGDLLGCRAYGDVHTQLLSYSNVDMTNIYTGRFFATMVTPDNCHNHVTAYYGSCGDRTISSSAFDFSLTLGIGGVLSANYVAADLGFDAVWIENIWLQTGDLKMVIETRVRHVERDPQTMPTTTMLVNPLVLIEEETGFPMFFSPTEAVCNNLRDPEFCYQQWCLVTEGAMTHQITDFSGFKPITFEVEVKGQVVSNVRVNIDLTAYHTGDHQHVDGQIDASLTLYRDSHFTEVYNGLTGSWLLDCEWLYGELELGHYFHGFVPQIHSAYICWSPTGDMVPYDPENPSTTGCNSRMDAVHYLVYSTDPYTPVNDPPNHDFQLIPMPPHPYQVRFAWMVHALTPFKQVLQIRWKAYGDGGALIEQVTEFDLSAGEEYQPPNEVQDGDHYMVKCAEGLYYDQELHTCVPIENGDDDDDDGDHPPIIIREKEGFGTTEIVLLSLLLATSGLILLCLCFGGHGHRHHHHHPHRRAKVTYERVHDSQFSLSIPSE